MSSTESGTHSSPNFEVNMRSGGYVYCIFIYASGVRALYAYYTE